MVAGSKVGKGLSIRRPRLGFCAKVSLAVLLALSFVVCWSLFSSPASDVASKRTSFEDIVSEPGGSTVLDSAHRHAPSRAHSSSAGHKPSRRAGSGALVKEKDGGKKHKLNVRGEQNEHHGGNNTHTNRGNVIPGAHESGPEAGLDRPDESVDSSGEDEQEDVGEVTDEEPATDGDANGPVYDGGEDAEGGDVTKGEGNTNKAKKSTGPLFPSQALYDWKLCGGRSGQNYIPCVDLEGAASGKLQSHRHRERVCPRTPLMCLIRLPQGYNSSVPWSERQSKILYRNVAHPMLSAYIKTHTWLKLSDDYLTFPNNGSISKSEVSDYLDFIVEMVPDIDWGKNIRTVLDIGSADASFVRALYEKDVLALSLGMMSDQTDLAQIYLESGFPALIGSLGTRRLPFPSGVFDAIHCSVCSVAWHANGGKLLIEMNRILRPGGYFILSFRHGDAEGEKGMLKLTPSICWNVLAHKTDEETDLSVKIYQRPSSNDMYELRRTKYPPICKEDENQDAAWYTPIRSCLHTIPTSLEQRGTEWPEEWPKRLENVPEWLTDSQDKIVSETNHWKAIIQKSYLNGMGIDWSLVRNVMDMKAIYGGFAAALVSQKIWVMNVVPIHAPNTLPVIFERGLIGVYHDWCEPFSTYPRSYDLLHADHLFSRLKNRCRHPVSIVVEMDRMLRPHGWAIIREKLEILTPLETILKSLNWEIRMSFSQNKQGILCAQKTDWRP